MPLIILDIQHNNDLIMLSVVMLIVVVIILNAVMLSVVAPLLGSWVGSLPMGMFVARNILYVKSYGIVFTTVHFFYNVWIGPINWCVCPW